MSMSNKHSNRRSYNAISQVNPIYTYFILLLYKYVCTFNREPNTISDDILLGNPFYLLSGLSLPMNHICYTSIKALLRYVIGDVCRA